LRQAGVSLRVRESDGRFGELHLRHVLRSYAKYYNQARTHLSLNKDALVSRAIQTVGRILPLPILGGCTTNMSGFSFRQGHGGSCSGSRRRRYPPTSTTEDPETKTANDEVQEWIRNGPG
jgi:hypothetical protein